MKADIIGTLPQHIIEEILGHLPIRDLVRTSILSSKWRYYWMSYPVVVFNDKSFEVSSNSKQDKKYKFVSAIFHVLLFHKGPLLQFGLFNGELNMALEIDQIITYLSTSNTLKSFIFVNELGKKYKLPTSLYSFQRLEYLGLRSCVFEPPLTFNGLRSLKALYFNNVLITAKMLQRLLLSCPLLEYFMLRGCGQDFTKGNKFTFTELFECLPSVGQLDISNDYMKHLVAGGMPSKFSTSLVHLKDISLDVCFMKQDYLTSLLCLIRSSPNLKKINILMCDSKELLVEQTSMNFLDLQEDLNFNLNYLKELEIKRFRILSPAVEFVKCIMAKSPVLEKVQLKLDSTVSVDEEVKMISDWLRHHFACASPSVKFLIER